MTLQQKGKDVYVDMDQWLEIRRRVLQEGVSKRHILRETGMHWGTLKKILAHPCPPGYQRRQRPPKPKIDPYLDRIAAILEADKLVHKKQRHTARRIWERLQEEGNTCGYTIVKDAVRSTGYQPVSRKDHRICAGELGFPFVSYGLGIRTVQRFDDALAGGVKHGSVDQQTLPFAQAMPDSTR